MKALLYAMREGEAHIRKDIIFFILLKKMSDLIKIRFEVLFFSDHEEKYRFSGKACHSKAGRLLYLAHHSKKHSVMMQSIYLVLIRIRAE
jgi:hypothetical protein